MPLFRLRQRLPLLLLAGCSSCLLLLLPSAVNAAAYIDGTVACIAYNSNAEEPENNDAAQEDPQQQQQLCYTTEGAAGCVVPAPQVASDVCPGTYRGWTFYKSVSAGQDVFELGLQDEYFAKASLDLDGRGNCTATVNGTNCATCQIGSAADGCGQQQQPPPSNNNNETTANFFSADCTNVEGARMVECERTDLAVFFPLALPANDDHGSYSSDAESSITIPSPLEETATDAPITRDDGKESTTSSASSPSSSSSAAVTLFPTWYATLVGGCLIPWLFMVSKHAQAYSCPLL